MPRKPYPTDLSDAEWAILAPLIPAAKLGGHPRSTDMREVCNAIYYHLKTGCQWKFLPGDFPPSSTVYSYYRKWQKRGIWEQLNHTLRDQVRQQAGKSTQPTAIAADSQSVKTTEKRGRSTALMVANESKGASGRHSSIVWDCC
jgi:putative transposase